MVRAESVDHTLLAHLQSHGSMDFSRIIARHNLGPCTYTKEVAFLGYDTKLDHVAIQDTGRQKLGEPQPKDWWAPAKPQLQISLKNNL